MGLRGEATVEVHSLQKGWGGGVGWEYLKAREIGNKTKTHLEDRTQILWQREKHSDS